VIWGLLPLLVRQQLRLGPEWFGAMLTAMGVGAVCAGFVLPTLRNRLDRNGTVTAASVLAGLALALLGQAHHWAIGIIAMVLYGVAWITGASTLQAAAQLSVPGWVRARAIGVYQFATFGALAAGSALGGWAGEYLGLGTTLGVAGALCAIGGIIVRGYSIETQQTPPSESRPGPTPVMPQPEPAAPSLAALLREDRGRVVEVVRYRIDPADRTAFLTAMAACRQVRLRSGALGWRLLEDVAHPDRWIELWGVESWTEHLREAGRMTEWDLSVLASAAALHRGPASPEASRYLNVTPDPH
jgi:MFS family permease